MSEETQPKEDRTPGIVSWNELCSSDPAASAAFYGELFGWSTEHMEMPNGTYTFFNMGERPAAGMFKAPTDETPSHWGIYVTVADIDAAIEKAQALGATVVNPKTEIPMGTFAGIRDPQGAVVHFWQFT